VEFPHARRGVGECGTTRDDCKAEYVERYYGMNVDMPRFVGGDFWWYYKQDMVPRSKALWGVLDQTVTRWPE
jgi:hypothetical protein